MLEHTILGLIEMIPSSGYDISKMFEKTAIYYWTVNKSQIYRTIDRLLEEDLVTYQFVQQTNKPNKKIYSITSKGKGELEKWLKQPARIPEIRHELLTQLTWSDRLKTEEIIKKLCLYKNTILEVYNNYNTLNANIIDNFSRTKREQYIWKQILQNGILFYKSELKWINETIEGLKTINFNLNTKSK